MDNKKIKFGVVGVGYLGQHHVKHLAKFNFIDIKWINNYFVVIDYGSYEIRINLIWFYKGNHVFDKA